MQTVKLEPPAFAAGDASAAGLLHTDVVPADMSLRAQLTGRIETTRYLGRILADVPLRPVKLAAPRRRRHRRRRVRVDRRAGPRRPRRHHRP